MIHPNINFVHDDNMWGYDEHVPDKQQQQRYTKSTDRKPQKVKSDWNNKTIVILLVIAFIILAVVVLIWFTRGKRSEPDSTDQLPPNVYYRCGYKPTPYVDQQASKHEELVNSISTDKDAQRYMNLQVDAPDDIKIEEVKDTSAGEKTFNEEDIFSNDKSSDSSSGHEDD